MKILLVCLNRLFAWKKEKQASPVHKEAGFITIITVLLMLAIVTIIGVSAIDYSNTESSIVLSDTLYKRNFYFAESAGYETAQRLENAALTLTNPTGGFAWIVPNTIDLTLRSSWWNEGIAGDYSDDTWIAGNSVRSETFYTTNPVANPSNLNILLPGAHNSDDIRLAAHFRGVSPGSSLVVTGATGRLYAFNVYGMYSNMAAVQGESLIEMGYRKRFL